jgi:hypothetical protein
VVRLRRLHSRPAPAEPEAGTRARERFERAVVRYHATVSQVPFHRLRADLIWIGEQFDEAVDVLRDAATVVVRHPEVRIRAIARAATLTAHATEAVMMAWNHERHGDHDDVSRCIDSVRTLVKAVRELIDSTVD